MTWKEVSWEAFGWSSFVLFFLSFWRTYGHYLLTTYLPSYAIEAYMGTKNTKAQWPAIGRFITHDSGFLLLTSLFAVTQGDVMALHGALLTRILGLGVSCLFLRFMAVEPPVVFG